MISSSLPSLPILSLLNVFGKRFRIAFLSMILFSYPKSFHTEHTLPPVTHTQLSKMLEGGLITE